jgi:GNAT superfamily N-acetyltransferase
MWPASTPCWRSRAIRRAESADAEAVLALWRGGDVTPSRTDDLEGLRRLLAAPDAALLVAVAGGEIAGTVIAGWDGWRGNIYRLAVHPGHRRRGIGRVSAPVDCEHAWAVGFWDSLRDATAYRRDPAMARYVCDVGQRRTASTP